MTWRSPHRGRVNRPGPADKSPAPATPGVPAAASVRGSPVQPDQVGAGAGHRSAPAALRRMPVRPHPPCTADSARSMGRISSGSSRPPGRRPRCAATPRPPCRPAAHPRTPASPSRMPAAAPDSSMVRIRYCLSARSAPSRGMVSTVINASICAHSGCMLAMTPSSANRPMSASSTSCAWAMTGRRSRGPLDADDVLDGVEGLAHRGVADGVDVDLQPEVVDPPRGLGQRLALPHLHAVVCAARSSTAPAARRSRSPPHRRRRTSPCRAVSRGDPTPRHDRAPRRNAPPASRNAAGRRRAPRLNRMRSAPAAAAST